MLTTMSAEDILAIVRSVHRNPHYVLGMHPVETKTPDGDKKCVAVRAFFPDAKELRVIASSDETKSWEADKIHPDGLFEAIIWERPENFRYKLKILNYAGGEWVTEDAYEEWINDLTGYDRYLFARATHYKIYEKMGAHIRTVNGKRGVFFSVWAPNAARVSVVGNFNNWDGRKNPMDLIKDSSGVWVLFLPGLNVGDLYKYEIKTGSGDVILKSDPYAILSEQRPKTSSVVHTLEDYKWSDDEWLEKRRTQDLLNRPMSIYEVHPGSWRRSGSEPEKFLSYRDLAASLVPYVKEMGFTHIQLMPIAEHPLDESWGYQVTGYYAPSSRFGEPRDLQFFVDKCHEAGIGVLLDWVPGHFPKDAHGLRRFDGTALYEHEDPRLGEHPDWGTLIFNYGRHEVKNFLISNALYWIDKFHFDGLRVDAVASMLYLDYGRKAGQWLPNRYGGKENLEAIEFLKHLNSVIYQYFPGIMMIAEESTSWAGVSRPAYLGGLGFGFKWNMGWMHDVLDYIKEDPVHKKYHHNRLTFGLLYAWSENFILPFSHDEVVHGKGSLINKMPGDYWQKFANLRTLYTFMWTHPGKQMIFMGQEFGQFAEWNCRKSLDWHLLDFDKHRGLQACVRDINSVYVREKALWQKDFT
ncbi:MAG: 1,4-alpha-glucan branching protein GlgB, partial [Endomicrobiia bacterium]|nr:1,4-alpha-glucan branching protein GlgB [Endomicrobiia bacterium]